jgi:hypothetical protein
MKGADFERRALRTAGDDPLILAGAAHVLAYLGEDIGAMMGVLGIWAGQPDIAIEHEETSQRLSPRARVAISDAVIGRAHFLSRRFDKAVPKLLLAIQDDPANPRDGSHWTLRWREPDSNPRSRFRYSPSQGRLLSSPCLFAVPNEHTARLERLFHRNN